MENHERVDTAADRPQEPIAICGMAARLPGEVRTPSQLWDMLMMKRNGLVDWPRSESDGKPAKAARFNADGFYSETPRKGTLQSPQAYLLDHLALDDFDPSFFPIGAKEAARLDPMQRQLLEVAYECAENAGAARNMFASTAKADDDMAGRRDVGVFVGVFGEDWLQENVMDSQLAGLYRGTGFLDFLQANRISFALDWQGPSMVIKTGCSASLVALDMACHSLRSGECGAAVVMGVNLITCPLMTLLYTGQGLLSPSGRCKTFDASADGYGRGEAVNGVYLKRLSDAVRDRDPIRAVVRASATGHDGRKAGQLKPEAAAQELLIRKTYRLAGISRFEDTAWIECHGTGTAVGDPLETRAIANVFGHAGITVGSVKPNVGHSEGAAGLTGLIKAVLSLEHRAIPPNIFFETPNPLIPWESARLTVPIDVMPWPPDRKERVSVNSFGVGGSNAHVILESHHGQDPCDTGPESCRGPHLLLFTATHPWSLQEQVRSHREYVQRSVRTHGATGRLLRDLAYTLGCRRYHFPYRTFAIVREQEPEDAHYEQPRAESPQPLSFEDAGHTVQVQDTVEPRIAFVFTGQGAQSARMGYELLQNNTVFADSIRDMDRALQALPANLVPEWKLFDELARPAATSRVHETSFSLPCCAAVQIGVVNVFRAWGVLPNAVVGHSSGEVASAYAAGVLSAREAIITAYLRGFVLHTADDGTPKGAMAAVELSPEQTASFLIAGAVVACENSPISTTISGDEHAVRATLERIRHAHPQAVCRMLKVKTAFHSHHVGQSAATYEALLAPFLAGEGGKQSCTLYSSVTGSVLEDPSSMVSSTRYWRESLAQPVLFRQALNQLVAGENSRNAGTHLLLVEIGPHPSLKRPVNHMLSALGTSSSSPEAAHIPTLVRNERADTALLRTAGELFMRGSLSETQLRSITRSEGSSCLTDLPPYAWHHGTRYFDPPRIARVYKNARHPPHELLGARVPDATDIEPCWRNVLEPADQPSWLGHHVVDDQVVFPAAGFMAMAGEAAGQIRSDAVRDYALRDVSIKAPLVVPPGSTVELFTRLSRADDEDGYSSHDPQRVWYNFHIMALVPDRDGDRWTSHCLGAVASGRSPVHRPLPSQTTERRLEAPGGDGDPNEILPDGFARRVNAGEWYSIADAVGLSYGASLRGLEDIAASTTRLAASAAAYDDPDNDSSYALHPASLDTGLQLGLVAMCQGLRRKCDTLLVPSFIKEVEVAAARHQDVDKHGGLAEGDASKLDMLAEVRWIKRGRSLRGTVTARTDEKGEHQRFLMRDITFSAKPLAQRSTGAAKPKLLSYIDWAPDAELADVEKLGSVADMLRLLAFKNPRLRVLCIGHDGDSGLAHIARRALQTQVMSNGHLGSTLTYAAMTPVELNLARLALGDGADEEPAPRFLDLSPGPGRALLQDAQSDQAGAFDLVLVDGAEAFSSALLALGPGPCASLLAPCGWFLIDRSTSAAEKRLSELGLSCVGRCSSSVAGFSAARAPFSPHPQRPSAAASHAGTGSENDNASTELTAGGASAIALPSRMEALDERPVVILTGSLTNRLALAIKHELERLGRRALLWVCDSGYEVPDNDGEVVTLSLMYLEPSPLKSLTATTFQPFMRRLASARGPVIWLLPPLQLGSTGPNSLCSGPDAACMVGLARTARNEHPALDLTTVEVDATSESVSDAAAAVARIVQGLSRRRSSSPNGPDADHEFGITPDGTVQIPRMGWSSLEDASRALAGGEDAADEDEGAPLFRGDAAYLIVGGLGGLGRSVSCWMAERGARRLVFLSRSAADSGADKLSFVDELASMGCLATCVAGSVEAASDVEGAIETARSSPGGLAGVLHMPMVLRDRAMVDMRWEDWSTAVGPKVRGAQNLHDALRRRRVDLDFFVLLSSVSGIVGQRGQANYNAANTYLDAFALYRRSLGLPASVLDLGILGHVGAVARDEGLAAQFRRAGYVFLEEQAVMRALAINVRPSASPQLVLGMVADPGAGAQTRGIIWERDPRMAKASVGSQAHAEAGAADTAGSESREFVTCAQERPAQLTTEKRQASLASLLGKALFGFLVRPLEQLSLTTSITSLGLDSFAAVELVAWIQQQFDVQLPPNEVNSGINLLQLASRVMEKLVDKHRLTNPTNVANW